MTQSSFDLEQQNTHIDSKIVVALERVSEAFRVLLWQESKINKLSPIQIQILIFVLYHSPKQSRVGYLAKEFNMTKATISDSVKVLLKKELLSKEQDPSDTRSFLLSVTEKGQKIAQNSASFANSLETPIHSIESNQKEAMLGGLLSLIEQLNQTGVVTTQRMCLTCSFHQMNGSEHYCNLIKQPLKAAELRLDCPEHKP